MGVGYSTEVHVQFDRPSTLYYPDELVTGSVSLRTSDQAIKLQSISLQLIGECNYTTPGTYEFHDGTGYSHDNYGVVHHCATFLNIPHHVVHAKGSKVEVVRQFISQMIRDVFSMSKCLHTRSARGHSKFSYLRLCQHRQVLRQVHVPV
jgi:hypothetical protein